MKTLLGICVMVAFMSMPVAFMLNPRLEAEFLGYETRFIGQEVAEVGELVRFSADGEIVRWECLPKTSDSESFGDSNGSYVVSFRKPGIYTVIAAVYANEELTIHTQAVTVAGQTPPDPIVVDIPATPITVDEELAKKVTGWATKYQVDNDTCTTLATNFETVAARIGVDLTTPGQIITATANLNTDLELSEGLMAELQAYLTSQSDVGNLKTAKQHLIVWNSIAKGLRDAVR